MTIEVLILVIIYLICRRFKIKLPSFKAIFLLLFFITGNVFLALAGGVMVPAIATLIHLVLYGILVVFLFKNTMIPGMIIAGLGSLLNFISLLINEGKMPVDIDKLAQIGNEKALELIAKGESIAHTVMGDNPLNFLGDFLSTPKYYPFPKVFSIGDILLFLGIFLFLRKLPKV